MPQRISVRLDTEATLALRSPEASGLTRSQAVRRSLVEAERRQRSRSNLTAEAAAIEADDNDRAEMLRLAAFMEQGLSQPSSH